MADIKKEGKDSIQQSDGQNAKKKEGVISRLFKKITSEYNYAASGVWSDPRNSLKVRIVKILNLTMNAFFNSSLQNKSMALTYNTVLSIVPAFALLVAIGRGFGLQDLLEQELYKFAPSQGEMITTALKFVDSYLSSATQGIFVGVGVVVLLWTIISLLSSIEDSFNSIWDVTTDRTLYQKFTDYIAICLMIPVLMICSSGMSLFMSDVFQSHIKLAFLTPLVNIGLELVPLVLCWLAFTLSYYLIPNTKVKFKYAAISGVLAAIAFEILQLLFMNGQLYVSRYNAIYGSFAFLPLMLVWLQLSWLVLLTGCMIAYSMQNVFTYNFMGDANRISDRAWHNVAIIVMSVCVKRFVQKEKPLTPSQIAVDYYLPIRVVSRIVSKFKEANLIYDVKLEDDIIGITPAVECMDFTVADFLRAFEDVGDNDFMPGFKTLYGDMIALIDPLREDAYSNYSKLLMKDLPLPTEEKIKQFLAIEAQ